MALDGKNVVAIQEQFMKVEGAVRTDVAYDPHSNEVYVRLLVVRGERPIQLAVPGWTDPYGLGYYAEEKIAAHLAAQH